MTTDEAVDPLPRVRSLLEDIVREGDAVRLGECLRGIHLPTLGGPDEPADLLIKALSLEPVDPSLSSELARVLGLLLARQPDVEDGQELSRRQQRLIYNALLLACSLPPEGKLFAGLNRLAKVVDGRRPLAVLDASRAASRLRRALACQQIDDSLEEHWLELIASMSNGAKEISNRQRAVLIEAWEGLLWIPPATPGEPVVHVGRIDRGLRRLHEVTAGRDGSVDILQRAIELLDETFPRSSDFWIRAFSPCWPDWPADLRHPIGERWPVVALKERTHAAYHRTPEPRVDSDNEIEVVLAGIWSEALGLERVGVHDNFFELGGDSLLALEVMSQLRLVAGVKLPMDSLFERPTIAAMAAQIESHRAHTPTSPIVPVSQDAPLPLSFVQKRLWILDQLSMLADTSFNVGRFRGTLDVAALTAALGRVAARHEALRTTFGVHEGVPCQILAERLNITLPVVDLGALPPDRRESEAWCLARKDRERPFDLACGPLFRATLISLAAGEHLLLLCLHQMIGDARSSELLLEDLAVFYTVITTGLQPSLKSLPVQYADYAVWQRDWLDSGALEEHLDYWRLQLAEPLTRLALPTDWPHFGYRQSATTAARLPALRAAALRRFASEQGGSLFMTMLAAFFVLLHRYTDETDLLVCSPIDQRREETAGLIGAFSNTLVLRVDLSGDPTFREILVRVRRMVLDAYAAAMPFDLLLDKLLIADLASLSSFMVAPVNTSETSRPFADLDYEPMKIPNDTARFDLALYTDDIGDNLVVLLEYNRDIFEQDTAYRMLQHLTSLLETVMADPERPLSRLLPDTVLISQPVAALARAARIVKRRDLARR
jgi:acyl carrier protein